jgi:1-acyl-sn-glycerol-3-phosphate acyltransferase
MRFLTFYFGGIPLMNRRVLRAYQRGGLEVARAAWKATSERALKIAGADLQVVGEENLPDEGCVLIYNEASLVDLVLLHHVIYDHADCGVGAEVFKRIPYMMKVAEVFRVVIFERGNRRAADEMLDRVTKWVSEGSKLAMGGEGRLTKDGSVGHFKRGGCLVAIRAGAPVVPVAHAGGPEMLPMGSMRMRPGKLTVSFGKPMSTDGLAEEDAPEFAQRVREEVVRMREEFREAPAT